MPCPRCKKNLKYLNNTQSGRYEGKVCLSDDSTKLHFGMPEFVEDETIDEYHCSCCSLFICKTEKDALKFLQIEGEG